MEMIGFEKFLKKLTVIDSKTVETFNQALIKSTRKVQGDSKLLCPVGDTGELRNSITSRLENENDVLKGVVYTNKYYGPYVEFGTGRMGRKSNHPISSELSFREDWQGMPAQPFLYPALFQNKKYIQGIYNKALETLLKGTK